MPQSVPAASRRGRPPSARAASHAAILDAVHTLLGERSIRDISMDEIAKRAGVGKPTLYKWWPTKASLVLATFHERLASTSDLADVESAEASIRLKVRRLIGEFDGVFGRVMADLIAEGQSEPELLRDLYDQHVLLRRATTVASIERAKRSGEFAPDADAEILVDCLFGPIYFRLLLRAPALTQSYGETLVDQVLRGVRRR